MNRSEITVRVGNNDGMQLPAGATVMDALKTARTPDLKTIIAAKVNGRLVDLSRPLQEDAEVVPVPAESPDGVEVLRHSTAHLMAQAVQRLFPGTQVTIGPTIEDGFFYDFKKDEPFAPEDLERIEAEMRAISKENLPVTREEMPRAKAIE